MNLLYNKFNKYRILIVNLQNKKKKIMRKTQRIVKFNRALLSWTLVIKILKKNKINKKIY